jgi:hypothetical protein
MFGILLWSIFMAREVGNIPVAAMYILRFVLRSRAESWPVAYCSLCFSTSSTSTCTLRYALWRCFVHLIYHLTACLLCLSFVFALYVPFRRDSPNKIHLAGKYRDLGFRSLTWTIRPDGTIAATSVSSFPIYSWFKSCLLGSKCMGFGDGD